MQKNYHKELRKKHKKHTKVKLKPKATVISKNCSCADHSAQL